MRRAGLILALLIPGLVAPAALPAQGFRGEAGLTGRWIGVRGLDRDSLPEASVPGEGARRTLADGTVVTCIEAEFCRWFGSGAEEGVGLLTQEFDLTAWPGVEGVSGHVRLRGRAGSDPFWPLAEEEFEALAAWVSYERRDLRIQVGRQDRTNGLGRYAFDGAAVRWRAPAPVAVDVYGGWSLARGLHVPRTDDLLSDPEPLAPDDRGLLLGVDVRGRLGGVAAAAVTYQREIRTDRAGLYTERVAADLTATVERFVVDLAAEVDLAFGHLNEARARVAGPIGHGFDASVVARSTRPFFELWSIWGAFSPVGHDEVRATVGWSRGDLRFEAGGGYRAYEETGADAAFIPVEDDAWRARGRARWARDGWFVDGSVLADRGTGAARYGIDLAAGRRFAPGTYVALRGTSSTSFSEFRLGEQITNGVSADGAFQMGDWTVSGGWGVYALSFDRPRTEDWTQQRGHLSVARLLGSEPEATPAARAWR